MITRSGLALVGGCMGAALIVLDASVLNVALPNIQRVLHANANALLWILNSYTLIFASLLILAGTFADRIGRRNAFLVGIALFALASLVCALSTQVVWLISGRILQGIGAALIAVTSVSIISHIYTQPQQRARAFGIWSGTSGIAFSLGPVVGGVLITYIGWQSIFLINLPVCICAYILVWRYVPCMPTQNRRWNIVGQILAMVTLSGVTGTAIQSSEYGVYSLITFVGSVIALLSGVAFVLHQRRAMHQQNQPLISRTLLSHRLVSSGLLSALVSNFCMYGMLLVFTLIFQNARHYSPLLTGLAFLPFTLIGAITGGFVAGPLMGKFGAPKVLIGGTALSALAFIPLLFFNAHSPYFLAALGFCILGLGTGLMVPALTNSVLSHSPATEQNAASSLVNVARQSGGVLGTSILGAIVATHPYPPYTTIAFLMILVLLVAVLWIGWRSLASIESL